MMWLKMTADFIDCLLSSNDLLTNWSKTDNSSVINNNDSYYFDKRPIETRQSHLESSFFIANCQTNNNIAS